jgi:MFS family permease
VLGLSAGLQGTLFFLLSLTQAFVGLACCRSRLWMYRAGPVLASGAAGIAGCLCLGYATTLPVLALGAVLIGCYAGTFFFYLVFHALAHPSRSAQYVSVNESLVGVGGIIGPVLGGVIADRAGFGPAYATAAVVLLATIAVQTVAHRRYAAAVDREADAQ